MNREVAILKGKLAEVKTAAKIMHRQAGAQDLPTHRKAAWRALLDEAKRLKAAIAQAEAAAIDASLRPSAAERAVHGILAKANGRRTSKPTATSAVRAVIQQSRSKVGRR